MSHEDQIRAVKDYDVILERCYAQNMGGGKYKSNLPDNLEIIMTEAGLSLAIIICIAVAIILGYKTGINTGLFCMVFAYVIGCFVMGLKPSQVIGFWPVNTMFVILSVSLFYNFAAINGTLEKLSGALLYACRKFPHVKFGRNIPRAWITHSRLTKR